MLRKLFFAVVVWLWLGSQSLIPQSTPPASAKQEEAAKSLEGNWSGTLDANGTKLRLLLKVSKKDGKLSATIDSLDQNANDIPVNSTDQTGDNVELELSGIAASFEGKLNAAGTEISGNWKQGGGSLPLVFRRNLVSGLLGAKLPEAEPKGPPATLAGFEDEASFAIIRNEERLGTLQSSWKKDGSFEGKD